MQSHSPSICKTMPEFGMTQFRPQKKSNFDELISVFKERFKDKQHLLDMTILQTHQGRTDSVLDYLSRLLKLSTNRNISDDILLAVAMNGLRCYQGGYGDNFLVL